MAVSLYYIIVADGSTAPTGAQVYAGVDYGAVTVLASGSVAYTAAGDYDGTPWAGASASTAYDQYWVASDGTTHGAPVKGEITTAAGRALTIVTGALQAKAAPAGGDLTLYLTAAGKRTAKTAPAAGDRQLYLTPAGAWQAGPAA
jgi:hypothetical protein